PRLALPDRGDLDQPLVAHLQRRSLDGEAQPLQRDQLGDLGLDVDRPLERAPGQLGGAAGPLPAGHDVVLRDLRRLGQDLLQGVHLLPDQLEGRHDAFVPLDVEFHGAPQDRARDGVARLRGAGRGFGGGSPVPPSAWSIWPSSASMVAERRRTRSLMARSSSVRRSSCIMAVRTSSGERISDVSSSTSHSMVPSLMELPRMPTRISLVMSSPVSWSTTRMSTPPRSSSSIRLSDVSSPLPVS